jgi:hypothetical protein
LLDLAGSTVQVLALRRSRCESYTPRFEGEERIPTFLQDAILAFVIGCAVGAARGQVTAHNLMLIHVSRFKSVHTKVYSQVDEWLTNLKRIFKYKTGGDEILNRMKDLWANDFEPTSFDMRKRDERPPLRA